MNDDATRTIRCRLCGRRDTLFYHIAKMDFCEDCYKKEITPLIREFVKSRIRQRRARIKRGGKK